MRGGEERLEKSRERKGKRRKKGRREETTENIRKYGKKVMDMK